MLKSLAEIAATNEGFVLTPKTAQSVVVLSPPVEEKYVAVLALLADGEAWASSGIALVLGQSQRTVQRALNHLLAQNKVQSFGKGRTRRWLSSPLPGFATTLLLPAPAPGG